MLCTYINAFLRKLSMLRKTVWKEPELAKNVILCTLNTSASASDWLPSCVCVFNILKWGFFFFLSTISAQFSLWDSRYWTNLSIFLLWWHLIGSWLHALMHEFKWPLPSRILSSAAHAQNTFSGLRELHIYQFLSCLGQASFMHI